MPHALLLSPDDQAVNAITGVLEEMSVTCERPLDGVSAAKKLNSQSFDLVLVDCENLPAAKLIFDVCRRGKNGNNPVPIAIVDGRAGLPTAFRLGAELILTKPVAKDQARSTIRTAVSRVRKDISVTETAPAPATGSAFSGSVLGAASATRKEAMAASAGATQQPTTFADRIPSLPAGSAATAAPAFDSFSSSRSVAPSSSSLDSRPTIAFAPSDDPVLAELERTELEGTKPAEISVLKSTAISEESAKPAAKPDDVSFSDHPAARSKGRGSIVVLLMLMLAGGGFYAAWMYQPGFRALAQPQIDRVSALVGIALPAVHTFSPVAAPRVPAAATLPAPAPPPTVDATKETAVGEPATAATAPAIASTGSTPLSTAPTTGASSSAAASSAKSSSATSAAASLSTNNAPVAAPVTSPISAKAFATQLTPKLEASKPVQIKVTENKKDASVAPASDAPMPGENTAIILSSKGAEKRLAHSVVPKYPTDAHAEGSEGTVVLKEIVDEDGKVSAVRLVEGSPSLATAAMQAVRQWRYRPYVRDGKAQAFQTVVIVDFQRP